jgi:hypothetical protein
MRPTNGPKRVPHGSHADSPAAFALPGINPIDDSHIGILSGIGLEPIEIYPPRVVSATPFGPNVACLAFPPEESVHGRDANAEHLGC